MEDTKYGDITTIGITVSGLISIEFYDPGQIDGRDFTTIYLTAEQAKTVARMGDMINGSTD